MLGSRIAALRTEKGWSQAELARRLNISASTVGMYEQGRREPPLSILVNMAGILGVSIDYLLTGKHLSQTRNQQRNQENQAHSLKKLSRDELLVLLTAELFENAT